MSSVGVLEVATGVKSMYMIKSWWKTRKGENMEIRRNLYINLHL